MLTEIEVKNAKPTEKPFKLADERGMYLLVMPGGGKLWRLKYPFEGSPAPARRISGHPKRGS